jgi:hypothetical protein
MDVVYVAVAIHMLQMFHLLKTYVTEMLYVTTLIDAKKRTHADTIP